MSTALMSVWPAGCLKQLVSLSYLDGWKLGQQLMWLCPRVTKTPTGTSKAGDSHVVKSYIDWKGLGIISCSGLVTSCTGCPVADRVQSHIWPVFLFPKVPNHSLELHHANLASYETFLDHDCVHESRQSSVKPHFESFVPVHWLYISLHSVL